MRLIYRLIIISALVAGSSWAFAQKPGDNAGPSPADLEQAKALFQQAETHKKTGDELSAKGDAGEAKVEYGLAAMDYLEAYKLSKLPLFLYNLGSIYRLRGNKQWAVRCYRAFVATEPDDEKDLKDALTFIDALNQDLAAVEEAPDPDASLDPRDVCITGDEPVETAPPAEPPEPVAAEPPAGAQNLGTEPVDEPARPGSGYRIGFWASAGVTVASASVAWIFALKVRSLEDDKLAALQAYQDMSGMQLDPTNACGDPDAPQNIVDICDDGKQSAVISNIFQGVALAGLAASGFFLYKGYLQKHPSTADQASATRITPVIGPSTVGAAFSLRF